MTGITALLKKEFLEQYRTHRLLIVAAVFALFGLGIPMLVKLGPELARMSAEGMQIEIPPPTAVQAFTEFAASIGQLGIVVAVMAAMGAVANELKHGTAVTTLSKPISRAAFVTAKLIATSFTFLVGLSVASSFCFFYTTGLIGEASAIAFLQFNLLMAVLLVFCLAVTVFFSCLFKSSLAAGGLAIATIIGQMLLAGIPVVGEYLPGKLLAWGTGIISGSADPYWGALVVSVALTVAAVFLGQHFLKNREI
jgi:ABC-2 type transport system permease protein